MTPTFNLPPWNPETDRVRLALLGKLLEELGEATQIAARCIIQGIDGIDPDDCTINRIVLEAELADVFAAASLVIKAFELTESAIAFRAERKSEHLLLWHEKLRATSGVDLARGADTSVWQCQICRATFDSEFDGKAHVLEVHHG